MLREFRSPLVSLLLLSFLILGCGEEGGAAVGAPGG